MNKSKNSTFKPTKSRNVEESTKVKINAIPTNHFANTSDCL